jgi:hypothetical protein
MGRTVAFKREDVVEGSVGLATDPTETVKRLGRDVAIFPIWSGDMTEFEALGVPPDDVGMMPFPAMNEKLRPVLQASNSFFMIGKDVLGRGGETNAERKAYRDTVWDVMTRICSVEGADEILRQKVAPSGEVVSIHAIYSARASQDICAQVPPENRRCGRCRAGPGAGSGGALYGRWPAVRDFYQRDSRDLVVRPTVAF